MKAFISAHGEKVFFAVVVVIGAWSLSGSLASLARESALTDEQRRWIDRVWGAVRSTEPRPVNEPDYTERFENTVRGLEVLATPVPAIAARRLNPVREGATDQQPKYVDGELPAPQGFAAMADRSGASLTWLEPESDQVKNVKILRYQVFRRKGSEAYGASPSRRSPPWCPPGRPEGAGRRRP